MAAQWVVSGSDKAVFKALTVLLPQLRLRVERSEMWIDSGPLTQARRRRCSYSFLSVPHSWLTRCCRLISF